MASKKNIEIKETSDVRVDKQSLPNCPTVFVDQLLGMQLGPFATKLTLGVQNQDSNGEEVVVPSLLLTIPTNQCLAMAKALLDVFSRSDIVTRLSSLQSEFQKEMDDVVKQAARM